MKRNLFVILFLTLLYGMFAIIWAAPENALMHSNEIAQESELRVRQSGEFDLLSAVSLESVNNLQNREIIYHQGFDDTTFPPTGWTRTQLGAGTINWTRVTPGAAGTAGTAYHVYNASQNPNSWLISPPIQVPVGDIVLTFYERNQYVPDWYGYSGVLISNGSGTAGHADFVEVYESDLNITTFTQQQINISQFGGSQIYIALVYQGLDAHNWWVDEVTVMDYVAPEGANLVVTGLNKSYSRYPQFQLPPSFGLQAHVRNTGLLLDQPTNVLFQVGDIYSGSGPITIPLDNNQETTVSPTVDWNAVGLPLGNYILHYEADHPQSDPNDRVDEFPIEVTQYLYAKDTGVIAGGVGSNTAALTFGSVFEINTEALITHVQIVWPDYAFTQLDFRLAVYQVDASNAVIAEVFTSDLLTKTADMQGEEVDFPVPNSILVTGRYILAVKQLTAANIGMGYDASTYGVLYIGNNAANPTAFSPNTSFGHLSLRMIIAPTTVVFKELTMLDPVGSGSVVPGVGVHSYPEFSSVNLNARPGLGFFEKWERDGLLYSTDRITPLTMDNDYEVQAFFYTPPGALTQNFNYGLPVPSEWSETNNDRAWQYGDESFFFNMFNGFARIGQFIGDAEEMLITPLLQKDDNVSDFAFWLAGGNNTVGFGGTTLQVKYSPVMFPVWENLGDPINLTLDEALRYVILDISSLPTGEYYFAFAVTSTFNYAGFLSWIGIDNVVGPVYAGIQQDDLEVSFVSYPNSIIFEGDIAQLSAEIKNVGLNTQTGTEVTFVIDDGVPTVLTANIGTLAYNETEIVTVNYTAIGGRHTITASVPADDNNVNNSAITQGVIAIEGNLAEGFEGDVPGWMLMGVEPFAWGLGNIAWLPPYEGVLAAYAGDSDPSGFDDEYLITPLLSIGTGDELNFYASYGNQSVGPASINVEYYSELLEDWVLIETIVPTDAMQLYTVDLGVVPPGAYFIGFRATGSGDGQFASWLALDHVIGPELFAELETPVVNIVIDNGNAILSWNPIVGANSYYIYASDDPYAENWGTPIGHEAWPGYTDSNIDLQALRFYKVVASTDPVGSPAPASRRTLPETTRISR